MARRRSSFGQLDKLPSGRWRARYVWPPATGVLHSGPTTFQTRTDAQAWLLGEHRLIERDEWTPPASRAQVKYAKGQTLADYAPLWLATHKRRDGQPLKARTVEHYGSLLDRRILPHLGDLPLRAVTEDRVRDWLDYDLPRTPRSRTRTPTPC